MKKCLKCNEVYYDETLVFCLEDGTELRSVNNQSAVATERFSVDEKSIETMFANGNAELPKTVAANDVETFKQNSPNQTQISSLKEKAVEKGYRTLEIGSLVFALAHNWWQWLYVERQNYGSISAFLFSTDFVIWFLLLVAGTVAGLLTLKFSRNKTLGYISLVILAINFLLILVPHK
ncbi:MAG TPA: hypothetical protein PKY59_05185 [Pyrinomonadaceae bacterium]|nr:hypothetical protein [Pyrinomonadaceae bacterium]